MVEISTDIIPEKAVLIGLVKPGQTDFEVNETLDELAFLAQTYGAQTLRTFTQKLERPDIRTFVGKGKLHEIETFVVDNEVDLLIFDDDLSPSQLRNIENQLKKKIFDRSLLILEIFHQRAQTSQARAQVELARLQYLLPRLTRMWTHLERQRGGTGTRGGAGEKEIETDKRVIKAKIALLKEKLITIDKQMATQRKNRDALVRVALVGYTNVGKSTIMNMITKADVFAENKLFATLDTTVRKVVIQNLPFLISDTVGFIRKLPHQLVESFKSTLDEVRESDILIHVVDISHPNFEDHIQVVQNTIKEIGAGDIYTIMVFNKIDAYTNLKENEFDYTANTKHHVSIETLKKTWMGKAKTDVIFISATQKINVNSLKELLYQRVREIHEKRYPYNNFLYPDVKE